MGTNTLLTLVLLASAVIATPKPPTLPVVDLGYELHRALSHDTNTDTYKFSNIRYAQPPTGNLRFRAPVPPLTNRDVIQTGEEVRACPQGIPLWQARAVKPTAKYSNGKEFNLQNWEADIKNYTPTAGKPPPPTTEDCLFLDVHVPRKVLDNAKEGKGCDTPVLVWIHGGGYILSSKNGWPTPGFEPSGLLQHAKSFNENGLIFVALNYRLGALGFLPGSDVQKDGDLNAGLLDQRLALQWVQDNIHLFGGSRDRVTVMGESAGGGSVLLHLLGEDKAPFNQVIAQSPAFIPTFQAPESAYSGFLDVLNVTSLTEARDASSEAIIKANAAQIGAAPATTYIYGPVLDKKLIPDYPYAMFKRGHFDKSVKTLASHTAFEGGFFFDVDNMADADFIPWIQRSIPGLSESEQKYLADELYPPKFDGSLGYTDQGSRQMALWGEAIIDCNFAGINKAVEGEGYAYQFNVTPGLHTQDLKYIFNDPQNPAFKPVSQDTLQSIITSFVINGVPRMKGGNAAEFPRWGKAGNLVRLNEFGAVISENTENQTRCDWWQTFRSKSN
ncbi:carboxylesterase family protein [Fusarium flagelliforme]|uniref:Carboxylic ester hydrolase n=1 Tax=Fusarium flagelliforme TaxID=2675880 RepID=A0A395N2Y6_9HYPO|nr:carboxylesterase family protein [Fusarium flagelliforme]